MEVGLNASRILIAAVNIGIARRLRDVCIEYAKDKKLKESTLLENAAFAQKIGQIEMQIEAMRHVCNAAARDYDEINQRPNRRELFAQKRMLKSAAVAKMFCGQVGWEIAGVASESLGGVGYTEESIIPKLVRDCRFVAIVEGGDEVLRDMMFSRFVLPQI
jgi:alkylation response protein AidB-like acyl-CoA dehydrogenase